MNAKRQNLLFTAHKDIRSSKMADEQLLVYDLLTNAAHSEMLFQVGIINEQEKNDIHQGLGKLFRLYQQGQWKLEADLEDVHFNIEHSFKREVRRFQPRLSFIQHGAATINRRPIWLYTPSISF